MDPYWQGGSGAYNNPAQRHDHPASSSSQPQFQTGGGYIVMNQQPRPSMPNVIGSQYNNSVIPCAPVYPPGAPVYAQQPSSATAFSAPADLIPYASANLPGAPLYAQTGAAADSSAGPARVPNPLALQLNVRSNPEAIVRDPEASDKLISKLKQNDHEFRILVTRWVLRDVRVVMGSHTGHAVLLALLGALERANMLSALEAIVSAVSHQYNGASLMEVANVQTGDAALKEIVRLAALRLQPVLLQRLFRCLIDGWNIEQSNGTELLRHFFTTVHFDHCSIFIDELAVPRFSDMVKSRIGYTSLMVCLENAGNTEQATTLQNTIVNQTVEIAKGRYSSCFLQAVLEKGLNDQLEERVRERVVHNLVELSMSRYGNKVVQECFVPKDKALSVPLLERGLDAFFRLPDEELSELVQNHWAGYVLRRLLRTSIDRNVAAEDATKLAQRMLKAGAAGDDNDDDAELPQVVDKRVLAVAILH